MNCWFGVDRAARRVIATAFSLVLGATAVLAADGDFAGTTLNSRLHRGMPRCVVIQAPLAFVGLDSGLQIWNMSDLASPQMLSHTYLPGPAFDVAVVDTLAYVADGEAGLHLIDVANPSNPLWLSALKPPPASGMAARGVVVAGALAYVAESGPAGALRVIDVSDTAAPSQVGEVAIDNGLVDVVLDGTTAWVALGSTLGGRHGLVSIDVTDPNAPIEVGYLDTGLPVNDIALSGTTAYLAIGRPSAGNLTVADISLPAAPMQLGSLFLADGAVDVSVQGSVVYIALRALGLHAYDVSNPASPSCLDSTDFGVEVHAVGSAPGFAVGGLRASNGAGGVVTLDTAVTTSIVQRAWMAQSEATGVAAISGGVSFLLRRDGLAIFDVSFPSLPTLLSEWSLPGGDYASFDHDANTIAIAEGNRVHLLDVTDPAAPAKVGEYVVSSGVAVRPVLAGTDLYVVTGTGLETFALGLVGGGPASLFPTSGWSTDFAVDGGYGYLTAGDTLHVLDLAVPTSPTAVGVLMIPSERLTAVDASGPLVVATGLTAHLYTVDVTDPTLPLLFATLNGLRGADVVLAGDRALIAAESDGLRVIDVSDPTMPVEDAFYDTSGAAAAIASYANDVYIATMEGQHWSLTCNTCNVCIETWPSIQANSLRGVRLGGAAFSWTIDSGSGTTNLHRTTVKSALATLELDMATLKASTAGTTELDADAPAPIFFYRVFGAGTCSGDSHFP